MGIERCLEHVVKHWNRLLRGTAESLFLETLKTGLDKDLSTLV